MRSMPDEPTVTLSAAWRLRSSDGLAATGAEISRPGFDAAGWTPTHRAVDGARRAGRAAARSADPYAGRNLEAIPTAPFAAALVVPHRVRRSHRRCRRRRGSSSTASTTAPRCGSTASGSPAATQVARRLPHLRARRDRPAASRRQRAGGAGLSARSPATSPSASSTGTRVRPTRSMGLWREVELRRTGGVSLDDVFVRSELDARRRPRAPASPSVRGCATTRARRARRRCAVVSARSASTQPRVARGRGEERELALDAGRDAAAPRARAAAVVAEQPRRAAPLPPRARGGRRRRRLRPRGGRLRHPPGRRLRRRARPRLPRQRQEGAGARRRLGGRPAARRRRPTARGPDPLRPHLNLNTIRLEGFWGSTQKLYDLADRYGIMVWVGWSCQWEWQNYLGAPVDENFGGVDTPAEMELVTASLRDQVVRLRNHPSVVVWNLGSDMLPRPELERRYRALLARSTRRGRRSPPARCAPARCPARPAVKMNGPYEWVPPNYWYLDTRARRRLRLQHRDRPRRAAAAGRRACAACCRASTGGRSTRCGATTSGRGRVQQPRPLHRSARRTLRQSHRASRTSRARRSSPTTRRCAPCSRPSRSAGRRRRASCSGCSTPPGPTSSGSSTTGTWCPPAPTTPRAMPTGRCTSLTTTASARWWRSTTRAAALRGAVARVRIFDAASRLLLDESRPLAVPAGERARRAVRVGALSRFAAPVYFLDARLEDGRRRGAGAQLLLAAGRATTCSTGRRASGSYTPTKRFADLTALAALPPAQLEVSHRFEHDRRRRRSFASRSPTPGQRLAFFVELSVVGDRTGELAAPIYWDDNYVSLLPGERRELRATFPAHAGERPVLRYQGVNLRDTAR